MSYHLSVPYSFSTQLMASNMSQKGSCWIQISKTFLAKRHMPLYSHLPLLSCTKSLLKLLQKQIWGMRGKTTGKKNWWLSLATPGSIHSSLNWQKILPDMKFPSPVADFLSNLYCRCSGSLPIPAILAISVHRLISFFSLFPPPPPEKKRKTRVATNHEMGGILNK